MAVTVEKDISVQIKAESDKAKDNLSKFEEISDNLYKCSICYQEVAKKDILTHLKSFKHLTLNNFGRN
jgi:hypothetical protein